MTKTYTFNARLWLYPGKKASWHFITLPEETAEDIDFYFELEKKGWGSLPVLVRIGRTEWKTSIFPDKKTRSYLLPIKAEVRSRENIKARDEVKVVIKLGG